MRAEILDKNNKVINVIIAERDFLQQNFSNWREIIESPIVSPVSNKQLDGPGILNLLSDGEIKSILNKTKSDNDVELLFLRLQQLPLTFVSDPKFINLLDRLQSAGVISAVRKQQLLN